MEQPNAEKRTESKLAGRLAGMFSVFPRRADEPGQTVIDVGQETQQPKKTRRIVRSILYAVISLLLATIIWGYVLMDQNPDREKTITGVTTYFASGAESDLNARKLMVYGDLEEVLGQVAVTVSAPLTEISKIQENNITATVDVKDVHAAGTYEIEVKATSTIGTVVAVEPDHITLVVDDITSRSVPVSCRFIGELPEGYWNDDPKLSSDTTMLQGAKTDLDKVSEAVCYVDLNGLTTSFNRSIPLVILDENERELTSSMFKSVIPAVTVSMTVLPHKHVNIEYEITDRDSVPDLYEIQSEMLSVGSLDIAADPDTLAGIDSIIAQPISIAGIAEKPGEYAFSLTMTNIPPNARLVNGSDRNVQLKISIADRIVTETFEDVPITFMNGASLFVYEYEFDKVDMTVSGPARLMNGFVSADVVVCVNLQQRGVGQYDFMLETKPVDNDTFGDLDISLSKQTVHVIVTTR